MRRMKHGFRHILAVRSKVVGNKVNDTVLRFVTSGRCGPAIGHVNVPGLFMRRKSITRLCRLYNVSRRKVLAGVGRFVG